jgi:hypothetical protein
MRSRNSVDAAGRRPHREEHVERNEIDCNAHVVSSLDGFVAKKDNGVSWMDSSGDVYERGITDDGAEVIQSIDCYVVGSHTYAHALQLGWALWRYSDGRDNK